MEQLNNLAATAKVLLIIATPGNTPVPPTVLHTTGPVDTVYVKPIKKVKPLSDSKALQPIEKLEPLSLPVAPTGTYQNDYEYGNCTEYVASRKKVPNSMGDANQWHYTLGGDKTPQIGSIAQSWRGYYGHVALVEEISNGLVRVSEANVEGLGVISEAWYPIEYFDNYIHV